MAVIKKDEIGSNKYKNKLKKAKIKQLKFQLNPKVEIYKILII